MVRACVARGFRRSVGFGSCINVSGLRLELCAPGHHGYQRACVLISGKASSGPFGSPVFACAGKTGPPSRLILSQTSAGNCGATSWLAPYRCSSFVRVMRPFLRPVCCLHPAPRAGAVKGGRRAWLASGSALPGHALTEPSTVPRSNRSGRHHICPGAFEVALLVENRPGDASELVGERDRQHVVVQPLLGGFDPRLEPVTFPALRPDQYDPGRLHEQDAQIAIAAPGYLAEDGAVSRRGLLGHQSEPGAEVATFRES